MNYISDILFWISTGLLVPVIVLLIFLFIRAVLLLGCFFGQYLSMRKTSAALQAAFSDIRRETLAELHAKLPQKKSDFVLQYVEQLLAHADSPAHQRFLLSEFEQRADKDLSLSRTLTKMGPMLGLMGTLIPMGPALVGLSTGDISSMAYNMQVAFATTVVGLFASAVGFITTQVKQRWYLRDMAYLELLSDLLNDKREEL